VCDPKSIPTVKVAKLTADNVKSIYLDNAELIFDDYVYDKHTSLGKSLGHGFKHFYEVGAKLVQCHMDDPYEQIAKYNNTKNEI
jgi:hypothetical protein